MPFRIQTNLAVMQSDLIEERSGEVLATFHGDASLAVRLRDLLNYACCAVKPPRAADELLPSTPVKDMTACPACGAVVGAADGRDKLAWTLNALEEESPGIKAKLDRMNAIAVLIRTGWINCEGWGDTGPNDVQLIVHLASVTEVRRLEALLLDAAEEEAAEDVAERS